MASKNIKPGAWNDFKQEVPTWGDFVILQGDGKFLYCGTGSDEFYDFKPKQYWCLTDGCDTSVEELIERRKLNNNKQ